jgi:hypothetical protein
LGVASSFFTLLFLCLNEKNKISHSLSIKKIIYIYIYTHQNKQEERKKEKGLSLFVKGENRDFSGVYLKKNKKRKKVVV